MRLMRKNQKKYLRIYKEYRLLMEDGSTPMEVYRYLGKKHRKSVGGIRYAIKSVEDMLRPVAPPKDLRALPQDEAPSRAANENYLKDLEEL